MSKYPITIDRLPTFVLLGHSNADGWVGSQEFFSTPATGGAPIGEHLLPATANPMLYPASAWYKNVYVFTSEHPWPGTGGTPYATVIEDGEWLELTIAYPDSPGATFPHASPFIYPNTAGACYPHWGYKAYDNILMAGDNGVRCGVELPLQWYWHQHWNSQVGIVKLAFGTSFLLPADQGADPNSWLNLFQWSPSSAAFIHGTVDTTQYDFISWWTPRDCFDFAPSTDRFFQRWLSKMAGAQDALPEGSKMDVQLIICWMGDNDAAARTLAALSNLKQFVLEFVRQARQACVDNDWTTLAEEEIPIVWMGVYSAYNNSNESPSRTDDFVNSVLQEIADNDPYFHYQDTNDYTTMAEESQTSFIDTYSHFGAQGYQDAAQDIYEAWLAMQTEPFDAIAPEDRIDLSELKSRIRTYYNRARSQTDADDATLLIHINGALHSILNAIGDNAYWLRRREQMSITMTSNSVTTMPRRVARVVKIESLTDPTEPVLFELVGFADSGKVQIQIQDLSGVTSTNSSTSTSTGTYYIHYITRPRDLSQDTQLVPLPRTITEWLVVETCRRLARSGSNVALLGSMEGEARVLSERCLKELQVTTRAKRDQLKPLGRQWPAIRYRRQ